MRVSRDVQNLINAVERLKLELRRSVRIHIDIVRSFISKKIGGGLNHDTES